MIGADLSEATVVMSRVLAALLASASGAQLRLACGQLSATGPSMLKSRDTTQFWSDFSDCFQQARVSGATFASMDVVRVLAQGLAPSRPAAIAVQWFAVRNALAVQAQILAATDFVSRQDIDGYFDQINASFDAAEQVAADALDNVSYTALVELHAAVASDLSTRARPLARMLTYTFPNRMPSLWLAQRVYCDASRADELVAENKPIHPLFMPPTGAALSA